MNDTELIEVPLCEFGCGVWVCLDASTDDGRVLVLDEYGLVDSGRSFRSWLTDWVHGVDLASEMITPGEEQEVINPFTRQPATVRRAGRAKGTPFKSAGRGSSSGGER